METKVIDTLLASGASKEDVDSKGMTAYGHFSTTIKDYEVMMSAMCGRPFGLPGQGGQHPSVATLHEKLMPRSGPTMADRTGGKTLEQGFMDYSERDREYDEMMGNDDSEEHGDY